MHRPAAVFAAALVLASCTGQTTTPAPSPAVEAGPVRIVVEGPMTGDQSATGQDMLAAAELAVDQANADGGVLGRQIEVIPGDDAADPAEGVALAERYADEVFAVIGPYNSSVGIENLPTWMEGGAIPIHLTSNEATDGMGYTVQPKDYQVAPIESAAMSGFLSAKRVAIVYDRSTYTTGIAAQVKEQLEEQGVEVVLFEGFDGEGLDPAQAKALSAQIAKADPDLFYASTYYPQGGLLAKSAASYGDVGCFMGLANQDPAFVEVSGSAAARRCVFSGVPSPQQFPRAKDYVADYEDVLGSAPGTWGTFAYDSVNLLLSAVEEAGSWDPDAVTAALSATKDFSGITGDITIDPTTGNRTVVPVVVLGVNAKGGFVVDRDWAAFAGFEG